MRKLMTAKDVSKYLSVSPSTVYAWANRGELPAMVFKSNRKKGVIRFRQEEIEKWIIEKEEAHREAIEEHKLEVELLLKKVGHMVHSRR